MTLRSAAGQAGPQITPAPTKAKKPPRPEFLTAQKTQLFLGRVQFRNIGVNMPDLFARFLRGDDANALQSLTRARNAGVLFVRCAGTVTAPDDFALFTQNPERWFAAFDRMLAACDGLRMTVVPSLLYDAQMLPRCVGRGGGTPDSLVAYLTPGSASNTLAAQYAATMAGHYKNDPRVLFWEIGDAYNGLADAPNASVTPELVSAFLTQMAALLHKTDRKHLVASGSGRPTPTAWHRWQARRGQTSGIAMPDTSETLKDTLEQYAVMVRLYNPAGTDIACTQESPDLETPLWIENDPTRVLALPWTQYVVNEMGKPLFVTRFAQPTSPPVQPTPAPNEASVSDAVSPAALPALSPVVPPKPLAWTLDFVRRMQNEGAPLSALWAWEPEETALKPYVWSPTRTPFLVRALAVSNAAITQAITSDVVIAAAPSLAVTENRELADRVRALNETVHGIAVNTLAAARVLPDSTTEGRLNRTGVLLHLPRAGADNFRIRDAAWMLGGDLISASEVEGWARLLASRQAGAQSPALANGLTVPLGSVPDHVMLDGTPVWFPDTNGINAGNGPEGGPGAILPPADNPFYFVQMVHEHFRLTGKPTLFRSGAHTSNAPEGSPPLSPPMSPAPASGTTFAAACARAFDSVPADATTGLVSCGSGTGQIRVDWGFSDHVRKSGVCLWPSLLRYRAARELAELYQAAGDFNASARFEREAGKIRASLTQVFYQPLDKIAGRDAGCLLSATEQGRKEDVWGEAFAVWLNVLPAAQADAVARHLRALVGSGGLTFEGQVRSMPPDGPFSGVWEQSVDAPGTGQNGAFWGLATGWLVTALNRVDRGVGAELLAAYLTSLQTRRDQGAPWECVNPPANYARGPLTCVSTAVPTIALRVAEPTPAP